MNLDRVPRRAFLPGKTVYLRRLQDSDLDGNYRFWLNDPEVCRHNSHGSFPVGPAALEEYVEQVSRSRSDLVLAIVAREGDAHVGNISLQEIDWVARSAEFAILLGEKAYWGRGIAKEAADLIVRHGFQTLGLRRIHCGTSSANVAMQRLAAYLGMKKEGTRRQAFYKDGAYHDAYEYGLLREEWPRGGRRRTR